MRRANTVDATVALYEAHRVPRQVVVDDVARLLEVHALGEHIGGDHDVVQIVIGAFGCVRCARGKSP